LAQSKNRDSSIERKRAKLLKFKERRYSHRAGESHMYNQFFALRENPFNVNPDPRYLFLTRETRESFDGLTHGIKNRKGLLLLTGEVGTGKTTLLNHLLDWLHQQRTPTAFIYNSHLEVSHLFDFVLTDFGIKFDSRLKDNAPLRLQQWLLERYRAGETPVVIVDEAQGLHDRVLEEIRMLLNLEACNEKLLQVVLAGQPELEDRLQQPALRQVKQRIALRCKTAALSLDEGHQYIQARLHIAGANGARIFSLEAMDAAHFYSRGIPRVINLLCEHALLNASVEQIQPVPVHFVAEVAREFQFDDIKPVASNSVSRGGSHPDAISVQSRFMNALVSLSAPAEPVLRERPRPSSIPAPDWSAPEDHVFSPVQAPAAPILDCERFPDDDGGAATSAPPSIPPAAPAAPWQKQLQTRSLSDWTAFFVEVGSSLASVATAESEVQPAAQPAQPNHHPRLHLVEAKPASGHSPVTTRCPLPSPQEFSHPSCNVPTEKSALLSSILMKMIALRLTLVRWSTSLRDRFLSAASKPSRIRTMALLLQRNRFLSTVISPAWMRTTTLLLQLPARSLRLMSAWRWEYIGWRDRGFAALESIDWLHLKITTSRWLREPCDPTQWRVPDSRLFAEMFRANHKKM
jgi:general secretion pathway protein A